MDCAVIASELGGGGARGKMQQGLVLERLECNVTFYNYSQKRLELIAILYNSQIP